MPPEVYVIPLNEEFRFVHEPLDSSVETHRQRFVGRVDELDELTARIVLSDGGAFLVTGYRGVGKSTFVNRVIEDVRGRLPQLVPLVGALELVDVRLNVPRAMEPVELMYHVLRGLYLRLSSLDILPLLDTSLRADLELAFSRTSQKIALKASAGIDSSIGIKLGVALPLSEDASTVSLGSKRTQLTSRELAYLAYDDKAAEYDLINIARHLSRGFRRPRQWADAAVDWVRRRQPSVTRLKVLLVFDELDKIDEGSTTGAAIDGILANLKTLFTTSGISFLFVAGKDIHDRWLDDVGRGDSIYESVFSYALYLPPLWAHSDPLCDPFLDRLAFGAVDAGESAVAYQAFKKFIAFSGRGIPRRILRKFNERVRWKADRPQLSFSRDDVRQYRFFADLYDVLVGAEIALVGEVREDALNGRSDRKRLGLYYLIDWILLRGVDEFTLQDAVATSRRLGRMIAPADEAAPAIIGRLLSLLVDHKYLEAVASSDAGDGTPARQEGPIRYRLSRRRLTEMGSITGVVEQEAQAIIKESKSQRFGGRYEVVSVLGRGGMSTVYLARDTLLGRHVAIKEQLAELRDDQDARARIRSEAEALSMLQHENIVRVFDVGVEARQPYIVMEYIEGVRLTDLIGGELLKDEREMLRIAHEVVRTLEYVHERGILWRDPKPGNIMITPAGRVVLLDFGISHVLATVDPGVGTLLGTPSYSSPEQLRGGPLDQQSDIYSLGVVLYQMATGVLPFGDDGTIGSAMRRLTELPAPPRSLAPVSEKLEAAILGCLAADKRDRFASVASLRAALPPAPASSPVPALSQLSGTAQEMLWRDADAERKEEQKTVPMMPGFAEAPVPSTVATAEDIRTASLVHADGSVTTLTPPRVTIGRSQLSHIRIDDVAASRFQAELSWTSDGWLLSDSNSRNATRLNGVPLSAPVLLRDLDAIQIGGTTLTFRLGGSSGPRVRRQDLFDFIEELRSVSESVPIEQIIERGLDRAIEISRAERGFVMVAEGDGDLKFSTARARGGTALPGTTFDTSRKIPQETFRTGQVQLVADLLDGGHADIHHGTVRLGIRHVLCIPLISRQGDKVGVLYLDSRERGVIHSNSVRDALQVLSMELAEAIRQGRLFQAERERDSVRKELEIAAGVQQAMQPSAEQSGAFYEMSARIVPSRLVGGDFYRCDEVDARHVAIGVGDVAGRGVAASLLAAFASGVIESNQRSSRSVSSLVSTLNGAIVRRSGSDRFATFFYGMLAAKGDLTYCNAGQSAPVVVTESGKARPRLEEGGVVLGLFAQADYSEHTIALAPGDTVVAFSDGVSEAYNARDEEFGEARIIETAQAFAVHPASVIADELLKRLRAHVEGTEFTDDVTILVLRYTGAA
jgi:serine/threonine protein kinase/serine phosphatase RsbU (regulator of sigma subunit)